jgi:universal stress protein A
LFKNILVPTDLSERSFKALKIAGDIASRYEASTVTLLHVIETIEGADDEFGVFYEKLRTRAQEKMEAAAAGHEKQELSLQKRIVLGKRVKEIVRFAVENAVDLIILSSHRIDEGGPSEGWATISYRVGILAPCPVMMVK